MILRRSESGLAKKTVDEHKKAAKKKAKERAQGAPSRVGIYMMELFVSKIVRRMCCYNERVLQSTRVHA